MTPGAAPSPGPARTSVAGTVRRPGGEPVGGAAVTVTEPGSGRQVSAARTDASGAFRVSLDAGVTYLLIVSAAGRRPAAELVTVPGGPVQRDVTLAGPGVLTGTARRAGPGDPAPGVVVTLTDAHGQVVAAGTTAGDGGYRLDGLEEGEYTLVGTAAEVNPVACAVTVPGTADLALGPRTYRVTALVTGPDDVPFAGAVVALCAGGDVVATQLSDDQGTAAFAGLPAGRYTLVAEGWGPGVAVARAARGRVVRADIQLARPGGSGTQDTGSWFVPRPRYVPAR